MKIHIALAVAASVLAASGALADRYGGRASTPSARFASFGDSAELSDASVTERVRSKLATNTNTRDLHIFVDTKNRVVRLRGEVGSNEERDLAELLARNTEAVAQVRNDLVVRDRSPVTR
jgi:osmotically-inducible protein OsmY